jgi:hypothetical protein
MTNLVSNAMTFTETGAVRIHARANEELVLSVQDAGPGAAPQRLPDEILHSMSRNLFSGPAHIIPAAAGPGAAPYRVIQAVPTR